MRDRRGAAVATLCCVVTTDTEPATRMGLIDVLKDSARRLSSEPMQDAPRRRAGVA